MDTVSIKKQACRCLPRRQGVRIRDEHLHRRCIRQIFGCVIHNGKVTHARSRCRTHHSALCLRFKMPELPAIILKRRLAWLGRIARLPDSDPQRKLLDDHTPYPPTPGRKRTLLPRSYVNDLAAAGIQPESWLQLRQKRMGSYPPTSRNARCGSCLRRTTAELRRDADRVF